MHRLDRTFLHPFDVRDLADELLAHEKQARDEALAARLRMPWTPDAPRGQA